MTPGLTRQRARAGLGALAAGLLAVWPALGCTQTSEMSISLDLPTDPALSPAGDRLAELALMAWEPGQPPLTETRRITDQNSGLDMGSVTADQPVTVAVELRSATERLIGYGASPEPVVPRPGRTTRVSLHVRRPFVYVAGDLSALDTFDTTLDPTADYQGRVDASGPVASAATPDGAELVVVVEDTGGATLSLVSTADHQPESGATSVDLAGNVSDVVVSADGSTAVVAHRGQDGGLSMVDLDAARAGQSVVAFAPIGAVGAVALVGGGSGDAPRAAALLDRTDAFGCDSAAPASTLDFVALSGDLSVQSSVDLAGPAADLATAPDGSRVYLAMPCSDHIDSLDLDASGAPSGAPAPLVALPWAGSVAVEGDRLWGAGVAQTQAGGLQVELVSGTLTGSEVNQVDLPLAQERIEFNELQVPGQVVEERVDADQLRAFELAALPGSDMVALLTEGYYHADESDDAAGTPIVPEMEITTYEYVLVDASTRTMVQRLRTSCEGQVLTDAVFTSFDCGQAADQDVLSDADSFVPVHLSALYGGK